jgi:hypothetical protein
MEILILVDERGNSDIRAICITLTLLPTGRQCNRTNPTKTYTHFARQSNFFFCSQSCTLETESYLHCFVLTSSDMGNSRTVPPIYQAIV